MKAEEEEEEEESGRLKWFEDDRRAASREVHVARASSKFRVVLSRKRVRSQRKEDSNIGVFKDPSSSVYCF